MPLTKEGSRRIEDWSPRKSLILEQKNSSSVRSRCPVYRVKCRIRCSRGFGGTDLTSQDVPERRALGPSIFMSAEI
jgi:hypothetical protein